MKRISILMAALLAIGFVRSDASATLEQDSLTANPKTNVLKLDNPRVRVFEATLKPGGKEQTHSHPASVFYVIEGGKIRNHAADGAVNEIEVKAGETAYRDPLTHWAENIGDTTIRLIVVELKQ